MDIWSVELKIVPFPLKYPTLAIINRTELCECSLTAGAFYITQHCQIL